MVPSIHTERWPLLVMRLGPAIDRAEIHDHVRNVHALLDERPEGRFGLIVDVRDVQPLGYGPLMRKEAAGLMGPVHRRLGHRICAQAWVAKTGMAAGAVRAFLWVSPRPWLSEVFKEESGAERWVRGHLSSSEPPLR